MAVHNLLNVIVRERSHPGDLETLYNAIIFKETGVLRYLPLSDKEELRVLADSVRQFHGFASRIFPYFNELKHLDVKFDRAFFMGKR